MAQNNPLATQMRLGASARTAVHGMLVVALPGKPYSGRFLRHGIVAHLDWMGLRRYGHLVEQLSQQLKGHVLLGIEHGTIDGLGEGLVGTILIYIDHLDLSAVDARRGGGQRDADGLALLLGQREGRAVAQGEALGHGDALHLQRGSAIVVDVEGLGRVGRDLAKADITIEAAGTLGFGKDEYEMLSEIAESCFISQGAFRPMTKEEIFEIYKECW